MNKEHFANLSKLQKTKILRKFVYVLTIKNQCRAPFNLTKIFRNSNFNFNDPDYETFFLDFMRPEIVKDSCLDAHSRILVLFQKGTKVTDDRYFGQGRVLLTKLKRRLVLSLALLKL